MHWSLLLLLMAAVVLSGCDAGRSAPRGKGSPTKLDARAVKTAPVEERILERNVVALGSFAASDQATLSAKISGRIELLPVDLGSVIKAGDVIARIEPREYELRVRQAQAALAAARAVLGLPLTGTEDDVDPVQASTVKEARAVLTEAQANRDRVMKLSEEGVVAKSELDTVESAYQVASNRYQDALEEVRQRQAMATQRRAELDIAQQNLSDTTIVAPFEGAIQERRAHVGEYVSEGSPIVTLVRMNPLRLRLEVSERDAPKIRLGQDVRVRVEGDDKLRLGKIQRISPAINEQNRMLVVEADVANDGPLHPGLFARASIAVSNNTPALVVPMSALVVFAGLEKVLLVKDGRALERLVVSGERGSNWVEVASGVASGDRVVLEPGGLQHQQPITILD